MDTIENGINYKARIIDVGCSDRTKSRLYFKNLKNKKNHVNVSKSDCLMFKVGDTISVFENKTAEWYEIDPGSLRSFSR
jgi:ribosomal protein S17